MLNADADVSQKHDAECLFMTAYVHIPATATYTKTKLNISNATITSSSIF
jgi:hypothetical protein